MAYNNFDELLKNYPDDRDKMSESEEAAFVEDCFEMYEKIGFKSVFTTPYGDTAKYKDMPFKVIRRLLVDTDNVDLRQLPMWLVKFENGDEEMAYPEEICKAEEKAER